MNVKLKARLTNMAVWAYTIANVVLVTGASITFLAGNETVAYIMIGAEILVNVFASINNPDFKGMVKDKEYIVHDAEEGAKVANDIINAIEKATKK